jgi:ribosomal protein S12 methylthiotransferase accessory factor
MSYVDPSTIHSPHLLELLEKIKQKNLSLEIWDISTEMKIPAYFVVLHDSDDLRTVGMLMGTGAHFSSVVALSRAITEAVQGRATIISGSRDDQTPRIYKKIKTKKNHLLKVFESTKQAPISFIETTMPDSFAECRKQLLAGLKQQGFNQVIMYNHSREHLDIPVVHLIVPGLRYIHGTCFSCSVSPL